MSGNREDYIGRLASQVEQWNAEIDRLAAWAKQARLDTTVTYERRIDEICRKRDTLRKRLSELREAGEGAWSELKVGTDKASQDLKDAIKRAQTHFAVEAG